MHPFSHKANIYIFAEVLFQVAGEELPYLLAGVDIGSEP